MYAVGERGITAGEGSRGGEGERIGGQIGGTGERVRARAIRFSVDTRSPALRIQICVGACAFLDDFDWAGRLLNRVRHADPEFDRCH